MIFAYFSVDPFGHKESVYGKSGARQKTMNYGKRTIVVTYKYVKGELRISNAWVKTK